ncbi:MAG: DUF441 domain-containing protein [Bacillota bacterium]|uniref:DUF441 domain-containing protein n=1 Tax=Desulfurispora thermophila TaxID=265470 RepID=UPI000371296E|nr:DUF441 domain-containing protein [Desulfurispora thermophila]
MHIHQAGIILLLLVALFSRSHLVAISCTILIVLPIFDRQAILLQWLEGSALKTGLTLLMIYILLPVAKGTIDGTEIRRTVTTLGGWLALAGGAMATHFNAQGLQLLQCHPEMVFSLTVGTVVGTLFFRGAPCGPVMAAAITAILLQMGTLI